MVFLDRDGVINEDSPAYIKSWNEFRLIPGSIEAIRRLAGGGFAVILITNQSAVGRGLLSEPVLDSMHENLKTLVANAGGTITDIFVCPHRPEDGCDCRKPLPGLIHQARQKYGIDLTDAVMVGDSIRDIECGKQAGCRTVLVRTGNGIQAEACLTRRGISPDAVLADLAEAAEWILQR